MDRRDFMRGLYQVAQAFENHWSRSQRIDPKNFPNELPEEEWWDQWEAFCESFDLEAKDGD